MTARHLPDVPEPSDALKALVTTKVINDIAALVAEARIDRTKQDPYVAGVNDDCTVCYIGCDVPDILSDGENQFHSDAAVIWHECGEWYFMTVLGLDYDDAHALVTYMVEKPFVVSILRLDWEGYQHAYDPYVIADDHENLVDVPADLFMGPYVDDASPELLAAIRRAQLPGQLSKSKTVQAAGVAYVAPSGDVLFVLRSAAGDHAGEWCLPAGKVEEGETYAQAAAREFNEETGGSVNPASLIEVAHRNDGGVDFVTFLARGERFEPLVDQESDAAIWAPTTDYPRPMHPGLEPVMPAIAAAARGGDPMETFAKDFDEDAVPRDEHGRWVSGGDRQSEIESRREAMKERQREAERSQAVHQMAYEQLNAKEHANIQQNINRLLNGSSEEEHDRLFKAGQWIKHELATTAAKNAIEHAMGFLSHEAYLIGWKGMVLATATEFLLPASLEHTPRHVAAAIIGYGLMQLSSKMGISMELGHKLAHKTLEYLFESREKEISKAKDEILSTLQSVKDLLDAFDTSKPVDLDEITKADTVSTATNLVSYDQSSASRPREDEMPWKTNEDLPDGVKNSLPSEAQDVFRTVANRIMQDGGSDVSAIRQAWTAVKNGWEKNKDGEWTRKKPAEKVAEIEKGTTIMDAQTSFFMPITKKEKQQDGSVVVTGYASTPTKDLDGEVISLDAVKKALPSYMEWRNIREMHQPSAVGVAKEANVDDKGLYLRARIVEPGAVHLVNEGVYQGFSIGGRKLAKTGDTVTDLELVEISIVDRPCNPDTRFAIAKNAKVINPKRIDLVKVIEPGDKIELSREEVGLFGKMLMKLGLTKTAESIHPNVGHPTLPNPAGQEGEGVDKRDVSNEEREQLADQGHALPDGSFPIKNTSDLGNAIQAHGRAKNPAQAKRHIIRQAKRLNATHMLPDDWPGSTKGNSDKAAAAGDLKKAANLYTVSTMIELLGRLEWLEECCEGEGGFCYGPCDVGGTMIQCSKEFTDKFGALLVQFGDMTSELLDMAVSQMKDEEAAEAAQKIAGALSLAKVWSDAAREAAHQASSRGWVGKPDSFASDRTRFTHPDHPDHTISVRGNGQWTHDDGRADEDSIPRGNGGDSLKEHMDQQGFTNKVAGAGKDVDDTSDPMVRLAMIAKRAEAEPRTARADGVGEVFADLKRMLN